VGFYSRKPKKSWSHNTLPQSEYKAGEAGSVCHAAEWELFFWTTRKPQFLAPLVFVFFVAPLLRKVQGLDVEKPLFARLRNEFTKKGNFKQFLKSNLEIDAHGHLLVSISDGQESFKISPMAQSNAWTILEENKTEFLSGDLLQVVPISFRISHD
jgi:hypothetical protein